MTAEKSALPETIRLRYTGRCGCGVRLDRPGERAGYDRSARHVVCLACMADRQAGLVDRGRLAAEVPAPPLPGTAGGSARREFDRRAAKKAERLAQRNRFVRFAAAFTSEPPSTTAWATGAVGEEVVARTLTILAERGVLALHDRRIPGRRSNIDHLVVSMAGVLVVDAKRYQRATIRTRRVGGLFTPRRDELLVRGRLATKLIEGLDNQVDAVRSVLDTGGFTEVPVGRALCFVDADFPWFTRIMRVGDTYVVNPRGLLELVTRPGPLVSDDQRYAVYCLLGRRLPPMR